MHTSICLKRLLSIILIIVGASSSFAQTTFFRLFNTNTNLPSNRVYKSIQDNDGFIWFATDAGVCKFDGHKVTTYTMNEGLTDYGAFHMLLDKSNRLWFFTFSGNVCYYKNGQFHPFHLVNNGDTLSVTWIDENASGELWFVTKTGWVAHCTPHLKTKWIKNVCPGKKLDFVAATGKSSAIAGGVEIQFVINNNYSINRLIGGGAFTEYVKCLQLKDGRIIVTTNRGIHLLEKDSLRLVLPFIKEYINTTIICIAQDNTGNLWMGNRNGAYCFNKSVLNYSACKKYLENTSVLSVLNDREGNIWFTTLNKGVMCAPDIDCKVVSSDNNTITHIQNIGGNVYLFNETNTVFSLKNYKIKKEFDAVFYLINVNYKNSQGVYLYYNNKTTLYTATDTFLLKGSSSDYQFGFLVTKEKSEILFNTFIVKKDSNNKIFTLSPSLFSVNYPTPGIEVKNGGFLFSPKNGVHYFNGKKTINLAKNQPILKCAISEMEADKKENIWLATKGCGMICMNEDKIIRVFNSANSIMPNSCNAIHIDNENNVWVATNKGLYKIQENKKIYAYTTFNTLPNNEVTSVLTIGDTLYAATPQGVVIFNKTKMLPYLLHAPKTMFSKFIVNGKETKPHNKYTLLHWQNNIKISFTGISFSGGDKLKYYYKLDGSDTAWQETTSDVVEFSSLNPGKYVFKVKTAIQGHNVTGEEVFIDFEIEPAYWQTWWFKLLLIFNILFILLLVARWFWNKKNHEITLKRKIVENELKALRAQINPHFIFNSLNSIQDFILDHQPEAANGFLNKFAMLIRMIVDYSKMNAISVEEENSFLTLYLELERLRYNDRFSFVIVNGDIPSISAFKIPPMIIQPIVENAIKHGLGDKKEGGEIRITYQLTNNNMLTCCVEDNGMGRKKAAYTESAHVNSPSIGLSNVEERLTLISRSSLQGSLKIVDLYSDTHQATGTRVEITFPKIVE